MNCATLVLRDPGGVQQEAPSLGKPVLFMRDTTERPEGISAGIARLVGTDSDMIVSAATDPLSGEFQCQTMAQRVNPYGHGLAAERITQAMLHAFGLAESRPIDFAPAGSLLRDSDVVARSCR